jgi:hypothetical protein
MTDEEFYELDQSAVGFAIGVRIPGVHNLTDAPTIWSKTRMGPVAPALDRTFTALQA